MEYVFSEISTTGKIPEGTNKASAIASGLSDWGCVIMGAEQPKKFGEGMAAIGIKFDLIATPDGLSKAGDELTEEDYK